VATVPRFLQPPAGSFFLFGPRGTGKSTWLAQHQKFYVFDAGVFRSLRPRGPLDAPEEIDGPSLEGLVAQHLRALCQRRPGGAGLEVVFVLYGPDLFLAVEVKRTSCLHHRDLSPLKAFREDYPEAQLLLLSFHPEPLLVDGIRSEPVERWLRQLRP
jgi:predicted AAA+ superfamily ATPase